MKKHFIFSLLFLILVISGCSMKNNNETQVINNSTITPISSQTETPTITSSEIVSSTTISTTSQTNRSFIPSVMDLKVGDKIGNFIVSKIVPLNKDLALSSNNFSISLNGTVMVTGNYDYNDMVDMPYLIPDTMSGLPVFLEMNNYEISFPKKYLPGSANHKGRVTITFNGLVLQSPSEEYAQNGSDTIIKLEILN